MDPGSYAIVLLSSTIAVSTPPNPVRFEAPLLSPANNLNQKLYYTLKDIHRRFSSNINSNLETDKLKSSLKSTPFVSKLPINPAITFQSFFEKCCEFIKEHGDQAMIQVIAKLGYDRNLYAIESKPIVMSIQSESTFEIVTEELDDDLNDFA